MTNNELRHFGILGMKWGVRRSPEQLGGMTKKDKKWVNKHGDKLTAKAKKASSKELSRTIDRLARDPTSFNKNGKLNSATIMEYNRKMASLMSDSISGVTSPSGQVVHFVAKRGEIGVFMALADQGYNMNQLKNGIYDSGKVAYRKKMIDKVETRR